MSDLQIEDVIFTNLVHDDAYMRSVLPYLKDEYFSDQATKAVFGMIRGYIDQYDAVPSISALKIELENNKLSQDVYDTCLASINSLANHETVDKEWLMAQTEKFCQDKAIYNAIMESIKVIDEDGGKARGGIPEILQNALSVSFDNSIGHDFLEDYESRYDFYHQTVEKLPFDIDLLNTITRGGIPRKTLNIILAGTGVGKTLMMCHFASANLLQGKNVLYVTLEMAEEKIAERIDANLLNIYLSEMETIERDEYIRKVERVRGKTQGKLIVKEYPTASVGAGHLRHLLNELKTKKKFVPDVIYIDYLNLCISSRVKMSSGVNSYTYIKAIAEELRGLAVEHNVPIISATQTNREGFSNSDVDLTNTSESFGLPATADMMIAAISTEELEGLGQLMIKQLKNRYGDPSLHRRFVVGIDRSRMRLYNVEQQAQDNIGASIDDGPVMDKGAFGSRLKAERFDSNVFDSWK